jgi:glycine cleavage system H protein
MNDTDTLILPGDLRYDTHHQWARWEDPEWRCGVTAWQAEAAGDMVYIGLPVVGSRVAAGEELGSVESGKWVSSLFAPVGGVITSVNDALREDPQIVNRSPYDEGWVFTIHPSEELIGLDAERYLEVIRAEEAADAPRIRERAE